MAQTQDDAHGCGWVFLLFGAWVKSLKSVRVTQILTTFLQEKKDIPSGRLDEKKKPYKEGWRQQTQRRCFSITESLFPNHSRTKRSLKKEEKKDPDETLKHCWRNCCGLMKVTPFYLYNHKHEETFYHRQSQTTTDGKSGAKFPLLRKKCTLNVNLNIWL